MDAMQLLSWARGPALGIASAIFLFGMILRLFELFSLGRKKDLAPPRMHSPGSGWRTVVMRSFSAKSLLKASALTYVTGYTFHIGFFLVFLPFPRRWNLTKFPLQFFSPYCILAKNS